MGIEEVKKEILDNARAQAKLIMKEAEKERSELLGSAESRIESIKERIEKDAERSISQYRSMTLAESNSIVKKKKLTLERDLIEEVVSLVIAGLDKLPAKKREEHLKKILASQSKEFSKVYCAKKDLPLVKKSKPAEMDIIGGAVLENNEGNVRLDLSYDTMLSSAKEENVSEIVNLLFG